ncbi:hypothetical protein F5888DRAFT_1809771 [Russula emetica]|nr:hypothetical protein F5888DRAFT_1809771 [Russula emetica]
MYVVPEHIQAIVARANPRGRGMLVLTLCLGIALHFFKEPSYSEAREVESRRNNPNPDDSKSLERSGSATSIDPKGYLSSLDSQVIKTEAEIGGIKRARMLFDSLIKSNPKHAPGWIAAAALEEHAGPARLYQNDDAKIILANAAQHVGQSVKIWLVAADLKHDGKAKKRVLRRALEHIPNLVRLWKETINLETPPADARILLSGAVEVIPLSIELWLALARLETPEKAIGVLNKARKAAYAAELSEEKRIERVDKSLATALKEAERCEAEGAPRKCEAIVSATVAMDVEEEDRFTTWLGDVEAAEARGLIGTARAVLAFALRVFPDRRDLWRRAADLEKAHGTHETLDKLLARAEKWLGGNIRVAREVLERASRELAVARELLVRARTIADTEQIWLKSAVFELQQGRSELALKTVTTALSKYPKFAKLYMVQGKIHQAANNYPAARATYLSRLEEADGKSICARALLEKARLVNGQPEG